MRCPLLALLLVGATGCGSYPSRPSLQEPPAEGGRGGGAGSGGTAGAGGAAGGSGGAGTGGETGRAGSGGTAGSGGAGGGEAGAGGGGGVDPCDGPGPFPAETCNDLDDDCDGLVDEAGGPCGGSCAVPVAPGSPCDGPDTDSCTDDVWGCTGPDTLECSTGDDTSELCNSVDDDCDGIVDEGDVNGCGGVCPLEHEAGEPCESADTDLCLDDAFVCDGLNGSSCDASTSAVELCNGPDEDCDGMWDEGACATLSWIRTFEGPGWDVAHDVVMTPDDAVVVAGWSSVGAVFGTGEPTETVFAEGGLFVARYETDGSLGWARLITTSGSFTGGEPSIAVTPAGDVLVVDSYSGEATFAVGTPEELDGPSTAGDVGFLARFDAGGRLLHLRTLDGNVQLGAVAARPDGSAALFGRFTGSFVISENGPAPVTVTTTDPWGDLFVVVLDSQGELVWQRVLQISGYPEWSEKISAAADGSLRLGLEIADGTLTLRAGTPSEFHLDAGTRDAAVVALAADGSEEWATLLDGTGETILYDMVAAPTGEVVAVGRGFRVTVPSANGPLAIPFPGELFAVALDASGLGVWATGAPGALPQGIAYSPAGGWFLSGHAPYGATFNDGLPNEMVISSPPGFEAMFLAKLDANGGVVWAKNPSEPVFRPGLLRLAGAAGGAVVVAGTQLGPASWDIGGADVLLPAASGDCAMIARFEPAP